MVMFLETTSIGIDRQMLLTRKTMLSTEDPGRYHRYIPYRIQLQSLILSQRLTAGIIRNDSFYPH